MHLLLAASAEAHAVFTDAPSVVGGGEARVVAKFREKPETALPKVVARAQQFADARDDVTTRWATRDDTAKMMTAEPVRLHDIMPGEPTLRLAQCGKHSLLPCDAPLLQHTWEIGRLQLAMVQRRGDSVRFGVKVK